MGIKNIGKFGLLEFIVEAPIKDIYRELVLPDREKIDYTSPIDLINHPLIVGVDYKGKFSFNTFKLPEKSVHVIGNILCDVSLKVYFGMDKYESGFRKAYGYGHEYLDNKDFLGHLYKYCKAKSDISGIEGKKSQYVECSKEVRLRETIAYLSGADIYLQNRKDQVQNNKELRLAHNDIIRSFNFFLRDGISY